MNEQQWIVLLEEERKQTKALNEMGCMVFVIAVIMGVGALLAVVSSLFGRY